MTDFRYDRTCRAERTTSNQLGLDVDVNQSPPLCLNLQLPQHPSPVAASAYDVSVEPHCTATPPQKGLDHTDLHTALGRTLVFSLSVTSLHVLHTLLQLLLQLHLQCLRSIVAPVPFSEATQHHFESLYTRCFSPREMMLSHIPFPAANFSFPLPLMADETQNLILDDTARFRCIDHELKAVLAF